MRVLPGVLLWCLLYVAVFADYGVTINGPDRVTAGDLVVLTVDASPSSKIAWTLISDNPVEGRWLALEGGRVCVFASARAGKYVFVCAVADGDNLAMITKLVMLEGTAPHPPTPPGPEPPAPPTPPDDWRDLSKRLAEMYVSRPREEQARSLAGAIRGVFLKEARPADLRSARELVRDATRKALGANYTRWLQWSNEVAKVIEECSGEIKTVDDYASVMMSVASGLEDVRD